MSYIVTVCLINAYQYWKETSHQQEQKDEGVSEAFDGDEYSYRDILGCYNL